MHSARRTAFAIAPYALAAITLLFLTVFACVILPSNGTWSGDTGIRILQVETIEATGDLAVPYLGQSLDPENRWNPFTPRYFAWRNGRYLPKFSAAYAFIAAGLDRNFGRQALVLPSIFGLLVSSAAIWYGLHRAGCGLSWVAPLGTTFLTPLVFYAAEFWEHSLATGLATAGTVGLLIAGIERKVFPSFLAGLAFGCALWLRGELYAYVPAVALAFVVVFRRPFPWRQAVATACGILLLAVPLWLFQQETFGSAEGAQVAVDSPLVFRGHESLIIEKTLRQWQDTIPGLLVPQGPSGGWLLAAVVIFAGAILVHKGKASTGLRILGAGLALLGSASLANLALRFAPVDLVASFPVGAAVLLVIALRPKAKKGRAFAFLAAGGVAYLVVTLVTAPSSGGAQHGPRYLLSIYPLWLGCLIIAFDELWRDRRAADKVLLTGLSVVLMASVATQMAGLSILKTTSDQYARIAVRTSLLPAEPLVTDLWWYPQVIPDEILRRPTFLVSDQNAFRALVARLQTFGQQSFTFVWSEETENASAFEGMVTGEKALTAISTERTPERKLVFSRYRIN